jgi:activator of HSP90 ATPase
MNDQTNLLSRRSAIAGMAISAGTLFAASKAAIAQTPAQSANQSLTALHQEIALKAAPKRIYEVLLDSKQFATFTGMPAQIDPKAGGSLVLFQEMVLGRNIELVPNQRIVQAWRPADWPAGVYSLVKFELKPDGSGTTVLLDHTGFPKGNFDELDAGWHSHYWEPLKKYLA